MAPSEQRGAGGEAVGPELARLIRDLCPLEASPAGGGAAPGGRAGCRPAPQQQHKQQERGGGAAAARLQQVHAAHKADVEKLRQLRQRRQAQQLAQERQCAEALYGGEGAVGSAAPQPQPQNAARGAPGRRPLAAQGAPTPPARQPGAAAAQPAPPAAPVTGAQGRGQPGPATKPPRLGSAGSHPAQPGRAPEPAATAGRGDAAAAAEPTGAPADGPGAKQPVGGRGARAGGSKRQQADGGSRRLQSPSALAAAAAAEAGKRAAYDKPWRANMKSPAKDEQQQQQQRRQGAPTAAAGSAGAGAGMAAQLPAAPKGRRRTPEEQLELQSFMHRHYQQHLRQQAEERQAAAAAAARRQQVIKGIAAQQREAARQHQQQLAAGEAATWLPQQSWRGVMTPSSDASGVSAAGDGADATLLRQQQQQQASASLHGQPPSGVPGALQLQPAHLPSSHPAQPPAAAGRAVGAPAAAAAAAAPPQPPPPPAPPDQGWQGSLEHRCSTHAAGLASKRARDVSPGKAYWQDRQAAMLANLTARREFSARTRAGADAPAAPAPGGAAAACASGSALPGAAATLRRPAVAAAAAAAMGAAVRLDPSGDGSPARSGSEASRTSRPRRARQSCQGAKGGRASGGKKGPSRPSKPRRATLAAAAARARPDQAPWRLDGSGSSGSSDGGGSSGSKVLRRHWASPAEADLDSGDGSGSDAADSTSRASGERDQRTSRVGPTASPGGVGPAPASAFPPSALGTFWAHQHTEEHKQVTRTAKLQQLVAESNQLMRRIQAISQHALLEQQQRESEQYGQRQAPCVQQHQSKQADALQGTAEGAHWRQASPGMRQAGAAAAVGHARAAESKQDGHAAAATAAGCMQQQQQPWQQRLRSELLSDAHPGGMAKQPPIKQQLRPLLAASASAAPAAAAAIVPQQAAAQRRHPQKEALVSAGQPGTLQHQQAECRSQQPGGAAALLDFLPGSQRTTRSSSGGFVISTAPDQGPSRDSQHGAQGELHSPSSLPGGGNTDIGSDRSGPGSRQPTDGGTSAPAARAPVQPAPEQEPADAQPPAGACSDGSRLERWRERLGGKGAAHAGSSWNARCGDSSSSDDDSDSSGYGAGRVRERWRLHGALHSSSSSSSSRSDLEARSGAPSPSRPTARQRAGAPGGPAGTSRVRAGRGGVDAQVVTWYSAMGLAEGDDLELDGPSPEHPSPPSAGSARAGAAAAAAAAPAPGGGAHAVAGGGRCNAAHGGRSPSSGSSAAEAEEEEAEAAGCLPQPSWATAGAWTYRWDDTSSSDGLSASDSSSDEAPGVPCELIMQQHEAMQQQQLQQLQQQQQKLICWPPDARCHDGGRVVVDDAAAAGRGQLGQLQLGLPGSDRQPRGDPNSIVNTFLRLHQQRLQRLKQEQEGRQRLVLARQQHEREQLEQQQRQEAEEQQQQQQQQDAAHCQQDVMEAECRQMAEEPGGRSSTDRPSAGARQLTERLAALLAAERQSPAGGAERRPEAPLSEPQQHAAATPPEALTSTGEHGAGASDTVDGSPRGVCEPQLGQDEEGSDWLQRFMGRQELAAATAVAAGQPGGGDARRQRMSPTALLQMHRDGIAKLESVQEAELDLLMAEQAHERALLQHEAARVARELDLQQVLSLAHQQAGATLQQQAEQNAGLLQSMAKGVLDDAVGQLRDMSEAFSARVCNSSRRSLGVQAWEEPSASEPCQQGAVAQAPVPPAEPLSNASSAARPQEQQEQEQQAAAAVDEQRAQRPSSDTCSGDSSVAAGWLALPQDTLRPAQLCSAAQDAAPAAAFAATQAERAASEGGELAQELWQRLGPSGSSSSISSTSARGSPPEVSISRSLGAAAEPAGGAREAAWGLDDVPSGLAVQGEDEALACTTVGTASVTDLGSSGLLAAEGSGLPVADAMSVADEPGCDASTSRRAGDADSDAGSVQDGQGAGRRALREQVDAQQRAQQQQQQWWWEQCEQLPEEDVAGTAAAAASISVLAGTAAAAPPRGGVPSSSSAWAAAAAAMGAEDSIAEEHVFVEFSTESASAAVAEEEGMSDEAGSTGSQLSSQAAPGRPSPQPDMPATAAEAGPNGGGCSGSGGWPSPAPAQSRSSGGYSSDFEQSPASQPCPAEPPQPLWLQLPGLPQVDLFGGATEVLLSPGSSSSSCSASSVSDSLHPRPSRQRPLSAGSGGSNRASSHTAAAASSGSSQQSVGLDVEVSSGLSGRATGAEHLEARASSSTAAAAATAAAARADAQREPPAWLVGADAEMPSYELSASEVDSDLLSSEQLEVDAAAAHDAPAAWGQSPSPAAHDAPAAWGQPPPGTSDGASASGGTGAEHQQQQEQLRQSEDDWRREEDEEPVQQLWQRHPQQALEPEGGDGFVEPSSSSASSTSSADDSVGSSESSGSRSSSAAGTAHRAETAAEGALTTDSACVQPAGPQPAAEAAHAAAAAAASAEPVCGGEGQQRWGQPGEAHEAGSMPSAAAAAGGATALAAFAAASRSSKPGASPSSSVTEEILSDVTSSSSSSSSESSENDAHDAPAPRWLQPSGLPSLHQDEEGEKQQQQEEEGPLGAEQASVVLHDACSPGPRVSLLGSGAQPAADAAAGPGFVPLEVAESAPGSAQAPDAADVAGGSPSTGSTTENSSSSTGAASGVPLDFAHQQPIWEASAGSLGSAAAQPTGDWAQGELGAPLPQAAGARVGEIGSTSAADAAAEPQAAAAERLRHEGWLQLPPLPEQQQEPLLEQPTGAEQLQQQAQQPPAAQVFEGEEEQQQQQQHPDAPLSEPPGLLRLPEQGAPQLEGGEQLREAMHQSLAECLPAPLSQQQQPGAEALPSVAHAAGGPPAADHSTRLADAISDQVLAEALAEAVMLCSPTKEQQRRQPTPQQQPGPAAAAPTASGASAASSSGDTADTADSSGTLQPDWQSSPGSASPFASPLAARIAAAARDTHAGGPTSHPPTDWTPPSTELVTPWLLGGRCELEAQGALAGPGSGPVLRLDKLLEDERQQQQQQAGGGAVNTAGAASDGGAGACLSLGDIGPEELLSQDLEVGGDSGAEGPPSAEAAKGSGCKPQPLASALAHSGQEDGEFDWPEAAAAASPPRRRTPPPPPPLVDSSPARVSEYVHAVASWLERELAGAGAALPQRFAPQDELLPLSGYLWLEKDGRTAWSAALSAGGEGGGGGGAAPPADELHIFHKALYDAAGQALAELYADTNRLQVDPACEAAAPRAVVVRPLPRPGRLGEALAAKVGGWAAQRVRDEAGLDRLLAEHAQEDVRSLGCGAPRAVAEVGLAVDAAIWDDLLADAAGLLASGGLGCCC